MIFEQVKKESKINRRCRFICDAARLAAIAADCPVIPPLWENRGQEFKDQFAIVVERQMGVGRSESASELHGAWMKEHFRMGWKYSETYSPEEKTHPDLVPYAKLGQLEKDKDSVFIVLCEIARQWIYDPQLGEKNASAHS